MFPKCRSVTLSPPPGSAFLLPPSEGSVDHPSLTILFLAGILTSISFPGPLPTRQASLLLETRRCKHLRLHQAGTRRFHPLPFEHMVPNFALGPFRVLAHTGGRHVHGATLATPGLGFTGVNPGLPPRHRRPPPPQLPGCPPAGLQAHLLRSALEGHREPELPSPRRLLGAKAGTVGIPRASGPAPAGLAVAPVSLLFAPPACFRGKATMAGPSRPTLVFYVSSRPCFRLWVRPPVLPTVVSVVINK